MATEYGLRLKAARNFAGLTQAQLATKTGAKQSTISTAEREGTGSYDPLYARACGVDAVWLVSGEGQMALADSNQPQPHTEQVPAAAKQVTEIASRRTIDSVDNALRVLAEAINQLATDNRDGVAGLLSSFGRNPDAPGTYAALLALLDSGNARRQIEPPVKFSRSRGG